MGQLNEKYQVKDSSVSTEMPKKCESSFQMTDV